MGLSIFWKGWARISKLVAMDYILTNVMTRASTKTVIQIERVYIRR